MQLFSSSYFAGQQKDKLLSRSASMHVNAPGLQNFVSRWSEKTSDRQMPSSVSVRSHNLALSWHCCCFWSICWSTSFTTSITCRYLTRATKSCCRQSLVISTINYIGRGSELWGNINLVDRQVQFIRLRASTFLELSWQHASMIDILWRNFLSHIRAGKRCNDAQVNDVRSRRSFYASSVQPAFISQVNRHEVD